VHIEGNLICNSQADNFVIDEYMCKIRNLQYLAKGKKRICEIGVNACHSLLLMLLVNPDADYILFDLNANVYTEACVQYVKTNFPNSNIHVIYGDSVRTLPQYIIDNMEYLNTFDLCHIDGGHTQHIFTSDYNNVKYFTNIDGIVIFDDYDNPYIKEFLDAQVINGDIVEYIDENTNKNELHFIYKYL
jgi:predicted O-methyltransferase YrrM